MMGHPPSALSSEIDRIDGNFKDLLNTCFDDLTTTIKTNNEAFTATIKTDIESLKSQRTIAQVFMTFTVAAASYLLAKFGDKLFDWIVKLFT